MCGSGGRPAARVRLAKKAWEDRHDASLIDRFSDELSGSFERVAKALLKGKRSVDEEADARATHSAHSSYALRAECTL